MPLAPKFDVSQDDEFVKIIISVPYVKVSDLELVVTDGTDFNFYCKPYLLRLKLPREVENCEDERCKAVYDCNVNHGTVTAFLPKKIAGEHFPDLDLITQLLAPQFPSRRSAPPVIEVLSSTFSSSHSSGNSAGESVNDSNDANGSSSGNNVTALQSGLAALCLAKAPCYGFNRQYSGVLGALTEEAVVMLELPDPDGTAESARRALRIQSEYAFFDADRYLGDHFGAEADVVYAEAMACVPFWARQWDAWKSGGATVAQSAPSGGGQCEVDAVRAGEELAAAATNSGASKSGDFIGGACAGSSGTAVPAPMQAWTNADADPGRDPQAQTAAPEHAPAPSPEVASEVPQATRSGSPKDAAFDAVGGFSELERSVLSGGSSGAGGLRNKEHLIAVDSADERSLFLGLGDVLFAFCHEFRLTAGEPSVESASNISRLSCCLGWMDSFREEQGDDEGTVIAHCARRSLVYPYIRFWKLTRKVLTDVCKVLVLGRRCVLKCLLQLRAIFERTDSHYMLNKLFVDDYCTWIQQVGEDALQRFAKRYNDAKNLFESGADKGKARVELNLLALEAWAEERMQMDEDDDDDDVDEDDDDEDDEDEDDDDDDEDEDDVDDDDAPPRTKEQAAEVTKGGNEEGDTSDSDGVEANEDGDQEDEDTGVPRRLLPRPPPHLLAAVPGPLSEVSVPVSDQGRESASGCSARVPEALLLSGIKQTESEGQVPAPRTPLIVEISSSTN